MSDATIQEAESLWFQAQESIRSGDLVQAARELSASFEILKHFQDPRLRQVHAKWIDVYQILQADTQSIQARSPEKTTARFQTEQAQGEAAANAGDLATALQYYSRVVAQDPDNELARERFQELREASQKAQQYQERNHLEAVPSQPSTSGLSSANQGAEVEAQNEAVTALQTADAPAEPVARSVSLHDQQIAFLEGLLDQIQSRRKELS
jgi:tetratricopeptide (TPR) repeat protein